MNSIEISQVQLTEDDEDTLERWERITDKEDILGVSADLGTHKEWPWSIWVNVAEFIREDPLESKLENAITSALRSVTGVLEVFRDDREVWIVRGNPSGKELLQSVSEALNSLAPELLKSMEE